MKRRIIGLTLLAFATLASPAEATRPVLTVGTRDIPPFAMRDENGAWSGITIDLWEAIARKLEVATHYQPLPLHGLLEGLQDGTLDVAAAALSITSERETFIDFSHPFYQTGLGIATAGRPPAPWMRVARGLVSWQFLRVLAALVLVLLIFGGLIWLFERRGNPKQFADGPLRGIADGFWWSAVTMTTVGYGDKTPVTMGGRLVALVWMFSGIIMISTITAAIAAALTVASLDTGIRGPDDLHRVKVATLGNTTSATYLASRGLHPHLYDSLEEALAALADGAVDAIVYDAPILAYRIKQNHAGKLALLPGTFERQQYGIALPYNSPLRQTINHALLELIEKDEIDRLRRRYLGL